MKKKITAVDLFCGSGGSSTGLIQACEAMGLDVDLLAVNHWDMAIATHSANHPKQRHLCTGVDQVDPRQLVRDGVIKNRINILWASPECTHHSIARGGKPMNDQSRATAWCVLRWCEALYIDTVIIENVKEFQSWGPIGANGRPLKSKKGETFLAFINSLKSLGYAVDYRVLNAADYGDPTSRERLFIIARRGNKAVTFPEPTHAPKEKIKPTPQQNLFKKASLKPYRTAREIIDWDLKGESIFTRKRPLSPNTMARIFAGLKKYCGLSFIVPQFGEREGQRPRTHSIDAPLPAVTSHGAGALVEPFIVEFRQNPHHRSVDEPLSTVATSGAHHGLCEPFIVRFNNNQDAESVDAPLSCVMTKDHHALCQPFVIGQQSCAAPRSVDRPLPTIATDGAIALVQPFIIGMEHGGQIRSVDIPLNTITTAKGGAHAIVEPFIVSVNHGQDKWSGRRTHSIDNPLPAVTTAPGYAIAQPYIVKYNGTVTGAHSIDEPLDTISTKDRFGLIVPELGAVLDIRFRMLQPDELSAAMGFPKDYVFTGTREAKVKQIGNAVCVGMSRALCQSVL